MAARIQVAISTDLVGDLFTISVWDVATGNVLTSFKAPSASGGGTQAAAVPAHCIDLVRDHYLLCTYQNSPTLHVWNLAKKDHLFAKMVLPGVVSALAVSGDGAYCLAAIDAKIYIWQISSGHLLNVLERHYQKIRVIRITGDLCRFVSAGDDGLVLLWDFGRCIVEREDYAVTGGTSGQFEPLRTLHASSAKINDLHLSDALGTGGGRGHLAVASEDRCVRIYSLEGGQLLVTVLFDSPVRSVVMDGAERFLFAGLASGDIIQTALSDWTSVQSIGTADKVIDLTTTTITTTITPVVVNLEEQEQEQMTEMEEDMEVMIISPVKPSQGQKTKTKSGTESRKTAGKPSANKSQSSSSEHPGLTRSTIPRAVFSGHTGAVTCLAITIDGHGLLSGSADRTCKLWHIKSGQTMRTCAAYKGALSNLKVALAPAGLFLYDSLEALQTAEPAAGQVSADVSLVQASQNQNKQNQKASTSSSSSYYKVPLFNNNSIGSSGRPTSYEALVKRAAQPPPPIVPFKREIYRPGSKIITSSSGGGGSWKAFERGVLMVANDDCSGGEQGLWPWESWTMPSEADIERIFTVRPSNSRPRQLEVNGSCSARGSKGNKQQTKQANGHADDSEVEIIEVQDSEMEDTTMSEQSKDELIAQLKYQNDQLYHYAIDEVFRSAVTKPD